MIAIALFFLLYFGIFALSAVAAWRAFARGVGARGAAAPVAAPPTGQSASSPPRRPQLPLQLRVKCPSCLRMGLMPAAEDGRLRCPDCGHEFDPRTKQDGPSTKLATALATALTVGALLLCWLLAVRPWSAAPASPGFIAVVSAMGFAASGLLVRRSDTRGRLGQGAMSADVFRELALAFAVMGLTAFGVVVFSGYLAQLETFGDQTMAVRRAIAVKAWVHHAGDELRRAQIGLRGGVVVGVIGLILLWCGHGRALDALLTGRKALMKALKIFSLGALCIGSFALAGATSAPRLANDLKSFEVKFDAWSKENIEKTMPVVARAVVIEATERALEADKSTLDDCAASRGLDCPADLEQALDAEAMRAQRIAAKWPRRRVGEEPLSSPSAQAGADAALLAERLRGWAKATARVSAMQARRADAIGEPVQVIDAPLISFQRVADGARNELAAQRQKRLSNLAGIGAGIILDLAPLKTSNFEALDLGEHAGRFAGKLAEGIDDALKAPLKDLIRDTLVRMVNACATKACDVQGEIARAADDPRAKAVGAAIAERLRPEAKDWVAVHERARGMNDRAEALFDRRIRPALERRAAIEAARLMAGENIGEWAELRARWAARLKSDPPSPNPYSTSSQTDWSPLWPRTEEAEAMAAAAAARAKARAAAELNEEAKDEVARLLSEWSDAAKARALYVAKQELDAKPAGWDAVFLDFLSISGDRAAVFAYMIRNDPVALNDLARRSGQEPDSLDYDDLFSLFARSVHGEPLDGPRWTWHSPIADSRDLSREFKSVHLPETPAAHERAIQAAQAAKDQKGRDDKVRAEAIREYNARAK